MVGAAPSCRWDPATFSATTGPACYVPDRQYLLPSSIQLRQDGVQANTSWGPLFDTTPGAFGLYGNVSSSDPDSYLSNNPFHDLATTGQSQRCRHDHGLYRVANQVKPGAMTRPPNG